jgi:hypothetical protein
MHPGQDFGGGAQRLALESGDFVFIAQFRQSRVGFPSIGMHRTARHHSFLDKTKERLRRTVGNLSHANASDPSAILLGCDNDQRLGGAAPPFESRPADLGFVHFDSSAKFIPTGSDHRSAKFMKNRPGGLVAAQAQDTLQPKRAGSVLLARHMPDRTAPQTQRQMAVLEKGPCRHCGLVPTEATNQPPSLRGPRFCPSTPWADKTFRPSEPSQVSTALLVGGKSPFQFQKRLRIVLNHSFLLQLGVGGVNRIALQG